MRLRVKKIRYIKIKTTYWDELPFPKKKFFALHGTKPSRRGRKGFVHGLEPV
jgi:hypothetical protein